MQPRGTQLESGTVIAGYRIDELIGRGGMGVVYRATNVALNRTYALKVLAPELANDEQFRDRFKREIRIAASLNHPNVVGIHYAGEHDGVLFLAMDLIHGTDLGEVIGRTGALEPQRAVGLLLQITSALDAAHREGLVHRDVKPANVLISVEDGREHAYLTDFGLAKRFDTATALTVKGLVVGTVDYMPPEQITGSHTDARTDVYALGCVFFQMLTGKVPYERPNSVATLFAHAYEPPPPLAGPASDLHPTLAPVIAKAMAKEPGERYFSAGDFARDAAAALQGARYTGPPSVVATGEAKPQRDEQETERAEAALVALEAAMQQPTAAGASEAPDPEPGPPTTISPAAPETVASQPSAPPPEDEDWVGSASSPQVPVTAESPATTPPPEAPATAGSPAATPPPREPVAPASPVIAAAAGGAAPPPAAGDATPPPAGGSARRYRWPIAGALALVAAAVVAIILISSGSSSSPSSSSSSTAAAAPGTLFTATPKPVPTNRVNGAGTASVRLNGDVATVTITTHGLLNGAPHALHIHAGGLGICPPASAARLHNGNLSISTTDGIHFYGPPQVALTTTGDTSPRSIVDFTRYPAVGDIQYTRKVTVPPKVAAEIRRHNAVIVIHGIDWNGNGIYDNVLDRSDLSNSLTGESTAPALCGPLAEAKVAARGSHDSQVVYTAALSVREVSLGGTPVWSYLCHLAAGAGPVADPSVRTGPSRGVST
jgi:serine/threonine protein kinase